jgi:CMP-2-keto-3-deoxyoctulosonic acid synthetase
MTREQRRKEWADTAQYEYPFGITLSNNAVQNYIDYLEKELEQVNFLKQAHVMQRSEQVKCQCKRSTFTRTVDKDYNPMCGKCGGLIGI